MKGLGLRKDGTAGIEYRERSPLVLPPSNAICRRRKPTPPPRRPPAGRTIPTSSSARQRKEAERKRKPIEPGVDDKAAAAEPDDRRAGLAPPPAASAGDGAGTFDGRHRPQPSTNAELGSKGFTSMFGWLWAPKEEYTPFTGEPPRSSLTEPPPGYRTPSPSQPYGVGTDKWIAPIDRQERARQVSRRRIEHSSSTVCVILRMAAACYAAAASSAKTTRDRIADQSDFRERFIAAVAACGRSPSRPCSPPPSAPRRSRTSATSRSPTGLKSWWCRTAARRSSPTWSGTRSAPPTRRRASPASRISSNI